MKKLYQGLFHHSWLVVLSLICFNCSGLLLDSNGEDSKDEDVLAPSAEDSLRNHRSLAGETVPTPTSGNTPLWRSNPSSRRSSFGKSRVDVKDFMDPTPSEGSLWSSSGQTNYYFSRNLMKGPGDLVLLEVSPILRQELDQVLTKALSEQEKNQQVRHQKIKKGIQFLVSYLKAKSTSESVNAQKNVKGENPEKTEKNNPSPRGPQSVEKNDPKTDKKNDLSYVDELAKVENYSTFQTLKSLSEISDSELKTHLPSLGPDDIKASELILDFDSQEYFRGSFYRQDAAGILYFRIKKKFIFNNGIPRTVQILGKVDQKELTEKDGEALALFQKLSDYQLEVENSK